MTLANKITVLRIIAIPFFVIALLQHQLLWARWIFGLSVVSDAIDGALARFRGERTQLGSFLDPLADKLLLVSAFVTFAVTGWIPAWVFIAVLSRDILIVMGWSLVFILTGNSRIEPRPLGKTTTSLQMAFAVARLFNVPDPLNRILLYTMIAATTVSAFDYVWLGNRRLSDE